MNTVTCVGGEREQRLNAILLSALQAMEKNPQLDRQQVLAAHPEFAAELKELFASRDCLQRWTGKDRGSLRPPAQGILDGELGSIGDFRLLREVGRGGMGVVYEAR